EDVEGLFAVDVTPGVPADRNLCLQNTASHSGKPELIRNHQLDLSILPRTHPWNIPVVGNHGRTTELLLNPLACCQPFIIESRHRVVLTWQSDGLPLSPRAERPDARRSRAGSARAARPDRKRRPDRPPQAPPSLPRAHLLERPAFAFQTQHGGIAV